MNVVSSISVYTQARARVEAQRGDDKDEVIVAQWNLNKALVEELMTLRMQSSTLSQQLDAANRKIAEHTFAAVGPSLNPDHHIAAH